MNFAFILTMPQVNTWNGKWTGEGQLYVRVIPVTKSAAKPGNFRHCFSDGWVANVEVKEVSEEEAEKLRKESRGFYGYDWMIDSILTHGEIRA